MFLLIIWFLILSLKKIWIKGCSGFFTNDSIYDHDLRQQYLVDDHLRMSCMGDLDKDVNEEKNNLLFFTPITFFMNHLFLSSQMLHRSFSKFVNRILSLWFLTQFFLLEAGRGLLHFGETTITEITCYCLAFCNQIFQVIAWERYSHSLLDSFTF